MQRTFTPTTYYRTFGSHPPVLHVQPGDTITTTTADAGGFDARGERVTEPGNPLTGPFFVDTAEPGDALVVRIDRITPNRPHGFTSTAIAPHVVDPRDATRLPARDRVNWDVDVEHGIGQIDAGAPLGVLKVPLRPMLGCIGVAPANGQAISTATSGPYGGNMDYRGVEAGVTLYFPVFTPGALLFVGDGHAVQGEGEIVGTGIEISMDVTLTVGVRKDWKLEWPRGETADRILAFGNARPLDQALQHATSELLRWLETGYGVDIAGASHLLGQCVEYDIGNVFDPAYTVVCKVAKSYLPATR
jgi:amidase